MWLVKHRCQTRWEWLFWWKHVREQNYFENCLHFSISNILYRFIYWRHSLLTYLFALFFFPQLNGAAVIFLLFPWTCWQERHIKANTKLFIRTIFKQIESFRDPASKGGLIFQYIQHLETNIIWYRRNTAKNILNQCYD